MIPLIVNEPSYIIQDKMCGILSQFTGVDKKTIKNELERLQNLHEREKQREKQVLIDRMSSELQKSPQDAKLILRETASQIEQVEEKYNENALSQTTCISFIENQKSAEEALEGKFAGFHLSDVGLKVLGEKLNGNWREDVFMCFGGAANSGKTSLCCQLAYEIASNPENNACVIYHTIDDSAPQLLPRFVVQAYGLEDLKINEVRNPRFYELHEDDQTIWHRREEGYKSLLKLVKEGRLILKDANDGASFAFGENLITHFRKKFPDRNVVYILDNLHNTPDYAGMEPRMRFKTLSNHMKETATKYHMTMVATVEYTKLPPKTVPNNNNIAETRAIIYDASFIAHLYNDLHEAGDTAYCVHEKNGHIMPRIRLGIGKNKITDFKGRVFLDMYPAAGLFRYVATEVAENDMRLRKRMVDSQSRSSSRVIRDWENNTEQETDEGAEWPMT
jgi:KaiC/GvpD/RAD55 family RecA-like ATPase